MPVKAEPSSAGRAPVNCPAGRLVKFVPDAAGNVAGNLASGIVPESSSDALREVKFVPDAAGNVAGNLASGIVPESSSEALRVVREAPEPLNVVAVTSPETLS